MTMMKLFLKKRLAGVLAVLPLALLVSCSDDSPTRSGADISPVCISRKNCSDVDLQEGFALIRSAEKQTVLGTNSKSAKANERPQMNVSFTYNFQLGIHEVTCGEFNNLMGGKKGVNLDCEKDSLPAVNVTYYDAVLYANAKSKKAGMDTAYSYTSAEFDKNGHCILLNGITLREVDAFRLPTEAEWVFAAGLLNDVENSWNSENSEFKTHEVCSKKDANGLCDLFGNVTEWVYDYLGHFYSDKTVTNFVGGIDGGSLGERVLKGGSYRSEPSSMNLYSRGDVYAVTGMSSADYVGFRLAYGKIENPIWLDDSGDWFAGNATVVASVKTISSILGVSKPKLAFRNDATGNLAFVDFKSVSPVVVEIKDTINVYHPDISPDGKKVAFCTWQEGISGKSSLYVRDLNANGTNLVKLDVESAVIPRWRVLDNGDTAIVYVTDAGNNKESSEFFGRSTWKVVFAKGKFGKPTKLFDGAYHGGISDDAKLSVTGARLLRARVASKGSVITEKAQDTIWYNSEQACNASLNKKTKQTLFLDFGGYADSEKNKTGRKFVGSDYRSHERLFVADSTGKLVSSVAAPSGYTFDHSEWVLNVDHAAVVTLANANGMHGKIALVDIKKGSVTTLVEASRDGGEELMHPCLWAPSSNSYESTEWDVDSVGVYTTAANQTYYQLSYKMSLFWSYKDSVEVVALGNSRMWAGFDPFVMSMHSINMGVIPCDMHCEHYIFKNYLLNHAPNLKYVVVGLDPDLWYNIDERNDIGYCMGDAPGFQYDINHKFYPDGVDSSFVRLVLDNAAEGAAATVKNFGWDAQNDNRGWTTENGTAPIDPDSTWSDCLFNEEFAKCLETSDQSTCQSSGKLDVCVPGTTLNKCLEKHEFNECLGIFTGDLEKLKDLVRLAFEKDIVVIGTITPMSPYYKETGAYGRHGMRRSHAKKIYEEFKKIAQSNSNFILFDENQWGEPDYPSSMANDFDHLNRKGAIEFTKRLNAHIMALDAERNYEERRK